MSQQPKKKSKLWIQDIDNNAQECFRNIECDSNLKNNIERKLQQAKFISEDDLDLDHILSQIPYKSILENLFQSCTETCDDDKAIPIISKVYEESFMRQPHHNENACVSGNMCECQFIDMCAPFTAVEFRLYNDSAKPQMCVLCSRRATQKMFYDMCYSGVSPLCVIQRYGNIFGQPGEYSVECMLACPQGFNIHCLPFPIMSHQRNKYTVFTSGGIKYNTSLRVRPLCNGISEHVIPDVPEGEPDYKDSLLDTLPQVVCHAVKWLHYWNKTGVINGNVIDYRLNTYLALPGLMEKHGLFRNKPWYGLMDIDDVLCFENLPNLWIIMHDTLKNVLSPRKKNTNQTMLHILFTQALPCFHQTNKLIHIDDNVTIALNVLLALLLGLYNNVCRKTHFMLRLKIFKHIHHLMTSPIETQQRFFEMYSSLIVLAFMEYIARITPLFWPAEYEFLIQENNMMLFFEKIPLICDEFRVIDLDFTWDELEVQANLKIHKCSRARRLNKCESVIGKKKRPHCDNITCFMDCPTLIRNDNYNSQDIHLLAHSYNVPALILQEGHSLIKVNMLPVNIRRIQHEKMASFHKCLKLRYISSRLHVCVYCLYNRNSMHSKFRLNIDKETLVCSDCLTDNVVSIDVIGRSVVVFNETYILCPCCCKVHVFQSGNANWVSSCPLHKAYSEQPKLNMCCDVCEDSNVHLYEHSRINHLTGIMESISFCFKHNPSSHVLDQCTNIFQMKNLRIRRSMYYGKSCHKAPYNY